MREGELPWTNLDDLHRESLLHLLDAFGIHGLGAEQVERLNRAWHRLDPWPDVLPGLHRLRRRYVLATLSNGHVALMVNMARRAGLPWDAVLGAEVARRYKPQPEAYTVTAELLGLTPAQCLMVAAHNSDLAAARAQGFRTAFVRRPTEHGPGQQSDLAPAGDWDLAVDGLVELADRLGC